MSYIKSALEIALEKTADKKLTDKEIADIKQQEKIDSILAKYYKGQIEQDQLWHYFKELPVRFLRQAQKSFLRSLTFQSNAYDVEKRRAGILALENLKKPNHFSDMEYYFEQIGKLQEELQKDKEELIKLATKDLEKNPERRLQTFQQGNQIIIKELSIEEALEQDKGLKQKINQLEKKYKEKFKMWKEKMSELINENDK